LQTILRLPKLELCGAALVVVRNGSLGVVGRLLGEEFGAEKARVNDRRVDSEGRDLNLERFHPALETELGRPRRRAG
jgi:hypothetical protein